jgi:Citrate transporter
MTLSITSSIAVGTFATVILAVASNRIHLTVAAMLGTVVLLVTGVLSARDVSETINPAEAMIALFFGGMVMARTLIATGLFDYLGAIGLRLVRGDGRRLLIAPTRRLADCWEAWVGCSRSSSRAVKATWLNHGSRPGQISRSRRVNLARCSVHHLSRPWPKRPVCPNRT